MCKKPLGIWFDKIDGFIKIYVGIRYFVSLGYNEIYDTTKSYKSKQWINLMLRINLIVILQESESIHIVLYQ